MPIAPLPALSGAPPLLTLREAGEVARSHPRTVRRWIAEGRLPALRAGGRHLVEREALEAFLRGGARS